MGDLIERLRINARRASEASRMMAEAKSLRQESNPEGRTDLYAWVEPEHTTEWQAADALQSQAARIAELVCNEAAGRRVIYLLQEGGAKFHRSIRAIQADCPPEIAKRIAAALADNDPPPPCQAARIAELEGELAAVREALQVFGGDAAIEAKRLFERMTATPMHTTKRKELAALHCEASKRAAMVRRALAQQEPTT
jgi:hypothetical protein